MYSVLYDILYSVFKNLFAKLIPILKFVWLLKKRFFKTYCCVGILIDEQPISVKLWMSKNIKKRWIRFMYTLYGFMSTLPSSIRRNPSILLHSFPPFTSPIKLSRVYMPSSLFHQTQFFIFHPPVHITFERIPNRRQDFSLFFASDFPLVYVICLFASLTDIYSIIVTPIITHLSRY